MRWKEYLYGMSVMSVLVVCRLGRLSRLLNSVQISLQADVTLRLFNALTLNRSDGKLPVIFDCLQTLTVHL